MPIHRRGRREFDDLRSDEFAAEHRRSNGPMDEIAERFDRVARGFTARVEGVAACGYDAWDATGAVRGMGTLRCTCVRHLVELGASPAVRRVGADAARRACRSTTTPPAGGLRFASPLACRPGRPGARPAARRTSVPGRFVWATAVDQFVTGDLLVHTWDLAQRHRAGRGARRRRGAPHVRGDAPDGRGAPPERPLRAEGRRSPTTPTSRRSSSPSPAGRRAGLARPPGRGRPGGAAR